MKLYAKCDETDAADPEAICEAVTRPANQFMAVKYEEQKAALMLYKTPDLLVGQRAAMINGLRAHFGEFGIMRARGPVSINSLMALVQEAQDALPVHAQSALRAIVTKFHALAKEIGNLEKQMLDRHRHEEFSQRLARVAGIGPITARAIAATLPDASNFRSGRQLAA